MWVGRLDPLSAGLHMLPLMGGVVVSSVLSGQLVARYRAWRVYPITGAVLVIAAHGLLGTLDGDAEATEISIYMGVLGAGIGLTNQILIVVAQDGVPPADLGVATSAVTFLRTLGGAVGVAAFGAAIDAHVRGALPTSVDPGTVLGTPAELLRLPAGTGDAVRGAFVDGAHVGFLVAIPVTALALGCIAALGDLHDGGSAEQPAQDVLGGTRSTAG